MDAFPLDGVGILAESRWGRKGSGLTREIGPRDGAAGGATLDRGAHYGVRVGVTRWRRYGKDRLYVKDADGVDLGWWDLLSDSGHATSPEAEAALAAAVSAWRATTEGVALARVSRRRTNSAWSSSVTVHAPGAR